MAATAKPRLMKGEIGEEAGVFNQTKNLTKPLKKSIWLQTHQSKRENTPKQNHKSYLTGKLIKQN